MERKTLWLERANEKERNEDAFGKKARGRVRQGLGGHGKELGSSRSTREATAGFM